MHLAKAARALLFALPLAAHAQAAPRAVAFVVDDQGLVVDPSRSWLETIRHAPSRAPDDALAATGENTFRVVVASPTADLDRHYALRSYERGGRFVDELKVRDLAPSACPSAAPEGSTCLSSRPLRIALDDIDREQPVSSSRSIAATGGGAIDLLEGDRPVATYRVQGPRSSALGPIAMHQASLRLFIVRDRPRGAVPFGLSERMATVLVQLQVARANAIWSQCGVTFGDPREAEVRVVDPPGPYMLAVGCDLGLPSSGDGEVRVKVEGRDVHLRTQKGEAPRAVARRLARALEREGLRVTVSDNRRIGPGEAEVTDLLVSRRDGKPATIEPLRGKPVSSDSTLGVCIGRVDFSDGLQHFTDVDAVAGTIEERALLKAYDDGDPRTIEVYFVPSFSTGGRIGESYIRGDATALANMLIEDRAGVRADHVSFALAHELGHVLLDLPGHADDFGADTPQRLMDSDAADPSPFGPRRLTVAECERALRQSGQASPAPLLTPVTLAPLTRDASGRPVEPPRRR